LRLSNTRVGQGDILYGYSFSIKKHLTNINQTPRAQRGKRKTKKNELSDLCASAVIYQTKGK